MMKEKYLLLVLLLVVGFSSSSALGQLAHHWTLDETVWSDNSISDRITGTLCRVFGAAGPAMGLPSPEGYGTAIDFTESDTGIWGIVTVPNAVPATGDFVIRALIKTTQTTGNGHIYSNNNGQVGRMAFMISNGYLAVFYGGLPNNFTLAPQTPKAFVADGQWHFVELSRRGNLFELLADGIVVGSHLAAGATISTSGSNVEWMIGRARSFMGDYDGLVADVKVYHQNYSFATDRAWDPSPALGTTGVAVHTDVILEWKTAMHPYDETSTRSDVTQHYLYFNTEPNFVNITPIEIAADNLPAAFYLKAVEMDETYYWRVDQGVLNSLPGDPNTLTGAVWSFETLKSVPVIASQSGNMLLNAGETAVFTVGVESISPVMFQLYKSIGTTASFDEETGMPLDTPVGNPVGPLFPPNLIGTLELNNVQLNDEGFYYVQVWNASGMAEADYTGAVRLSIRRLVQHWSLDETELIFSGGEQPGWGAAELANNVHDGIVAYIYNGDDPNNNPAAGLAGAVAQTGTAIETKIRLQRIALGELAPEENPFTISLWFKKNSDAPSEGLDSQFHVIGTNQSQAGRWNLAALDLNPADHTYDLQFFHGGVPAWNNGTNLAPLGRLQSDTWYHVALARDDNGYFTISLNGKRVFAGINQGSFTQGHRGVLVGRDAGFWNPQRSFIGAFDDIRIYNYGRDALEIAYEYAGMTNQTVCFENPALDLTGDCVVDLEDFMLFAVRWLECGLIPQTFCD